MFNTVSRRVPSLHHPLPHKHTKQSTASLLFGVLSAQIKPTFHKMNVHAAMTPDDIWNHLEPVFTQARKLKDAFEKVADQRTLRVPFVTVSNQH